MEVSSNELVIWIRRVKQQRHTKYAERGVVRTRIKNQIKLTQWETLGPELATGTNKTINCVWLQNKTHSESCGLMSCNKQRKSVYKIINNHTKELKETKSSWWDPVQRAVQKTRLDDKMGNGTPSKMSTAWGAMKLAIIRNHLITQQWHQKEKADQRCLAVALFQCPS